MNNGNRKTTILQWNIGSSANVKRCRLMEGSRWQPDDPGLIWASVDKRQPENIQQGQDTPNTISSLNLITLLNQWFTRSWEHTGTCSIEQGEQIQSARHSSGQRSLCSTKSMTGNEEGRAQGRCYRWRDLRRSLHRHRCDKWAST
jgi:hypothetical protein